MKQNYPPVSVVIPAFNEEKFIEKTLLSLKSQNFEGKLEIIVVDNNSTDDTAKIAKRMGAKVVFENRKGVQFARQAGFRAAHGTFIASTDADCILPPHWLKQLVVALNSNSEWVAVGGWFNLNKGFWVAKTALNNLSSPALFIFRILTHKSILIGQNFIVRKAAFSKTSGFTNLTAMGEDLQFAQKLAVIGEVKFMYGRKWKIITSPRRWSTSFVRATVPYVVNAISFGLFNKIIFKDFPDIRLEESGSSLMHKIGYPTFAILIIIAFLAIPINPVNAKIMPATKRTRIKITAGTKNMGYQINKSFINSRHQVYTEYAEQKSRFLH